MTRPKSAAQTLTGLVGIVIGLALATLLSGWAQPLHVKTVVIMAVVGITMIAVEVLLYHPERNPTTGLALQPVNPLNPGRIAQKLVGFWSTIGLVAALYWLFPEYGEFYQPFREACFVCLPVLIVAAPIYIAYVDRRQLDPDDAYVQVARLIAGQPPADWSALRVHARGWLVKGFFLPLMFVFMSSDLSRFWSLASWPELSFGPLYEHGFQLLYLCDVLLATVGYVLTMRLFDSHIRSAEPTVLGWAVCIVCYPPFWSAISGAYLQYDQDDMYWGHFLGGVPVLYEVWGSLIILLIGVYVWATAAFGIRFSNLTHRGIITSGPYRWVKHPAYIAKNITWWMISVPFLTSMHWSVALKSSLLLLGVNLIYFARAVTEERHLSRDPVYRDYQAYIAEHGLFAIMRRYFSRRGTRGPVPAVAATEEGGGAGSSG